MPVKTGHITPRSDTKKFAKCGIKSYSHCLNYGYCCAFCDFGITDKRKENHNKLFQF